ncbi:MAG TPA: apolipoprotein N-acyltransferase [Flavisolibacter sp.]|jgi:apolipoprotein N-acyltransferase|nr:apolipoprotein N-acyltransferase [Flavisolibacter sp.]
MRNLNPTFAFPILAGIFAGCSIVFHSPVLSLICLVPLLLLLFRIGSLSAGQGFLFSATIAVFLFSWMISGAERFTGSSMLYGLGAFLLSALFFFAYWSLAVWLWARFHQNIYRRNYLPIGILLSSAWTLLEEIFFLLISDLPWFGFRVGYGLSTNLLALQYASLGGAGLISFIAVFFNFLLAQALFKTRIKQAWQPLMAAAVFALGGWGLLTDFTLNVKAAGSVKVVIANQNIPPEKKWNEINGNALASELIRLSKTAATHQPQLIVWPESILPWTYQPGDDLTGELLKQTPGAAQIIGMNTEAAVNTVFNSAYYIQPNEEAISVYHKQQPLAFIEKPLGGVLLPFLSGGGYNVQESKNSSVIETKFGNAGILICNESAIPALARAAAMDSAQFLVNISNDGWFADSYLARAHWQHARLRAVEIRKDVVVSSNRGYSGVIQASGNAGEAFQADEPAVIPVEINRYNSSTVWVRMPFLFIGSYAAIIILSYLYFLFTGKGLLQKRKECI